MIKVFVFSFHSQSLCSVNEFGMACVCAFLTWDGIFRLNIERCQTSELDRIKSIISSIHKSIEQFIHQQFHYWRVACQSTEFAQWTINIKSHFRHKIASKLCCCWWWIETKNYSFWFWCKQTMSLVLHKHSKCCFFLLHFTAFAQNPSLMSELNVPINLLSGKSHFVLNGISKDLKLYGTITLHNFHPLFVVIAYKQWPLLWHN